MHMCGVIKVRIKNQYSSNSRTGRNIKVRNSYESAASRGDPSGLSASAENAQFKNQMIQKESQSSLSHIQAAHPASSRNANQSNHNANAVSSTNKINRQSKEEIRNYIISPIGAVG